MESVVISNPTFKKPFQPIISNHLLNRYVFSTEQGTLTQQE